MTSECICQRGLRAILGRAFKSLMMNLRIYSASYIASARISLMEKWKKFCICVKRGMKRVCSETLAGLVISATGNSDTASRTTWFRYPQKNSIFFSEPSLKWTRTPSLASGSPLGNLDLLKRSLTEVFKLFSLTLAKIWPESIERKWPFISPRDINSVIRVFLIFCRGGLGVFLRKEDKEN